MACFCCITISRRLELMRQVYNYGQNSPLTPPPSPPTGTGTTHTSDGTTHSSDDTTTILPGNELPGLLPDNPASLADGWSSKFKFYLSVSTPSVPYNSFL